MPFLPLDLLKSGASELGIELDGIQLDQFDRFAAFMVETNRKFNLTRITDPEAIVTNHILDSLTCLWAVDLPIGAKVIDVGTGAGFPGIPVKIARPDLHVTLLDGTFKKVKFLSEAIALLSLGGIEPVHGRAEELAHEKGHRERYDAVYVRALSELKPLVEMCLPFAKVGGRLVAQKGPEIEEELAAARPMIGQLGGAVEKTVRTHIPGTDVARTLVVISKIKQTPRQYPRAYAKIAGAARRPGIGK